MRLICPENYGPGFSTLWSHYTRIFRKKKSLTAYSFLNNRKFMPTLTFSEPPNPSVEISLTYPPHLFNVNWEYSKLNRNSIQPLWIVWVSWQKSLPLRSDKTYTYIVKILLLILQNCKKAILYPLIHMFTRMLWLGHLYFFLFQKWLNK